MRPPTIARSKRPPLLLPGLLLVIGLLAPGAPAAGSTESELNAHWRGAWVVIGTDVFSACSGNFTNNEVRGRRVQSKGEYRFRAGEIGTVYKVDLKRKQVEVLIDLAEPIRVARQEGPFTLYDQLGCRVELLIPLPRGASDRFEAVNNRIAELLERHENSLSAESSEAWNGRIREPYPEDYDQTLFEYELWRAEQVNAEVAARIETAVDEAARLVDRVDDDPEYLAGFARGIERARDQSLGGDCQQLLSRSVQSLVKTASKDEHRSWREGFEDGQKLALHLEIGRRLGRCFLPPPR